MPKINNVLPLLVTAFLAALPAVAGPCALPHIDGGLDSGQADQIDRDRTALLSYEACLTEQQELESTLNSDAADRTARQLEAAVNLRRTLDAWQRMRRAADTQPTATGGY